MSEQDRDGTRSGLGAPAVAAEPVMRVLARPAGAASARELPSAAVTAALAAGALVWIDVRQPDAMEAVLREHLGLAAPALVDWARPGRMPHLDRLADGVLWLTAFAVRLDADGELRLRPEAATLVIGTRLLVTLRHAPLLALRERLAAALAGDRSDDATEGARLVVAALDALVTPQLAVLLRAAEVAEELDERLDPWGRQGNVPALERLIVLRRDLLAFRRLAVAQQEVVRRLGQQIPTIERGLHEVAAREREAVEMAVVTCDYIDGAIEAYRLRRDARTEGGVRRLTVLAAIFAPLSLVIALWGTQFRPIPGIDQPWGWPTFVGILGVLAALAVAVAYRRGLL